MQGRLQPAKRELVVHEGHVQRFSAAATRVPAEAPGPGGGSVNCSRTAVAPAWWTTAARMLFLRSVIGHVLRRSDVPGTRRFRVLRWPGAPSVAARPCPA